MSRCKGCVDNKDRKQSFSLRYQPMDCKRCHLNPLFSNRYKEKPVKNMDKE